jgi:hypothetical protein
MDSDSDPASELIEHFKLDAQYHHDYTLQVSYAPNPAQGFRKVRVEKRWQREKPLGFGTFGTVWLEVSREGEGVTAERAVKELRKGFLRQVGVDYGRELLALAKLSKVQDRPYLTLRVHLLLN